MKRIDPRRYGEVIFLLHTACFWGKWEKEPGRFYHVLGIKPNKVVAHNHCLNPALMFKEEYISCTSKETE